MKKLLVLRAVVMAAHGAGRRQTGIHRDAPDKPLADAWPTYSGDYSGKRYSALTQINQRTSRTLTLAWTRRLSKVRARAGRVAPDAPPVIAGGEGDFVYGGATHRQGVDPADQRRALRHGARQRVGARRHDGREIWHYVLEDERRHAHRQSWRRHLGQLPVLCHARTTT